MTTMHPSLFSVPNSFAAKVDFALGKLQINIFNLVGGFSIALDVVILILIFL